MDAGWSFEALGVAVVVAVLAFRIRHYRGRPLLYGRIQAILDRYEGEQLSRDGLSMLEEEANAAFRDILTGVGLLPGPWEVRVHVDELLGPVARVHGPRGEVIDLADFERRVRQGRIQLGAG